VVLHVRNVVIDCAAEGARYGALADRDPAAGRIRTQELIRAELSDAYARRVSAGTTTIDGLDTVEIRVEAPLPVAGLFGVGQVLTASGHAIVEPR
jgi:hypothetical protein